MPYSPKWRPVPPLARPLVVGLGWCLRWATLRGISMMISWVPLAGAQSSPRKCGVSWPSPCAVLAWRSPLLRRAASRGLGIGVAGGAAEASAGSGAGGDRRAHGRRHDSGAGHPRSTGPTSRRRPWRPRGRSCRRCASCRAGCRHVYGPRLDADAAARVVLASRMP